MKKKTSAPSNTKIAVVFFAFLVVFAGLSLMLKAILVIRAGQFDDSKKFNLSISNNKNTEVISFSPSTKSINVFKLDNNIKPQDAGKFLEIPIDGVIESNSLDLNQKSTSIFLKSISDYKNLKTNLTILDVLKLLLFARTVPENSINSIGVSHDLISSDADKIVGRLVSDELVQKDNQTIQIINGTEIGGLGNRLARLITNMGGNVIVVATANSPINKSSIAYIDKKTYTVEKLTKILGYETIRAENNPIADITITIGGDKVNFLPF